MAKLKLGTIPDDKPVKLTVELPAPPFTVIWSLTEMRLAEKPARALSSPRS